MSTTSGLKRLLPSSVFSNCCNFWRTFPHTSHVSSYKLIVKRKLHLSSETNSMDRLGSNRRRESAVRLDEFDIQPEFSATDVDEEILLERDYANLARSMFGLSATPSYNPETLLLVHPRLRVNGKYPDAGMDQIDLKLEEAVALCQTIPGFRVAKSVVIATDDSRKKRLVWGSGRLEALRKTKNEQNVTAIMVNTDILSPIQQSELNAYFGVPVYDRYTIVLSIFKLYARTKEAHLQIQLAEIPYIRRRMKFMDFHTFRHKDSASFAESLHIGDTFVGAGSGSVAGGSGEERYEILRLQEHSIRRKIKAAIESKEEQVALRLTNSKGSGVKKCLVGVVGYTNAGKTTLIKKLTGSKNLHGENRLFATLDTTVHQAVLPSGLKMLLADTIGFIADLPINLLASFAATLRHIGNADLSHPNLNAQRENVEETLLELGIPTKLVDGMISVGNKFDKLSDDGRQALEKDRIFSSSPNTTSGRLLTPISCRTGEGLEELTRRIDLNLQRITGSRPRKLKIPIQSASVDYLYSEGLVTADVPPKPTECAKYLIFHVMMTDAQMEKMKATVGTKFKKVAQNNRSEEILN